MFQDDPSHNGVGTGNPVLTAEVLWKNNGPSYQYGTSSWSAPTIVNGVVYVGSGFYANPSGYHPTSWGDVYAFKASNGALVWDYRDNSSSGFGTPSVVDGVVFFSSNNYVGALKASDGKSIWNNTANGGTSPDVLNGVFYDNNGHIVYALNATNGNQIWASDTPGLTPPAVAYGVLYTCSLDHDVYALNATNGDSIWNYTTGSFVEDSSVVANGLVYVGSDDNNIYALNASTGAQVWNLTTAGLATSPTVSGDDVYLGSNGVSVYCLTASNGDVVWNITAFPHEVINGETVFPGMGEIQEGPTLYAPTLSNEVVYISLSASALA
jgi:outer membrane protein assembly factor BamB